MRWVPNDFEEIAIGFTHRQRTVDIMILVLGVSCYPSIRYHLNFPWHCNYNFIFELKIFISIVWRVWDDGPHGLPWDESFKHSPVVDWMCAHTRVFESGVRLLCTGIRDHSVGYEPPVYLKSRFPIDPRTYINTLKDFSKWFAATRTRPEGQK